MVFFLQCEKVFHLCTFVLEIYFLNMSHNMSFTLKLHVKRHVSNSNNDINADIGDDRQPDFVLV